MLTAEEKKERNKISSLKYRQTEKYKQKYLERKLSGRYNKTKEEARRNRLLVYFGLSMEEYAFMLAKQNGVCAICGNPETMPVKNGKGIRNLSVDHNHITGKIRALLCSSCNHLLGKAKDNIEILTKAIEYLKEHS